MRIDARSIRRNETIATDVCVIGGGPAGLTVVRELAGSAYRVCLLESGGTRPDEQTQNLCAGAVIGNYDIDLTCPRARQYGGSANLWHVELEDGPGVRHTPFDPIDFEKRDWLPNSGWPFDAEHLRPYYDRAQTICRIGPNEYEPEFWEEEDTRKLPLADGRLVTRMFQFGLSRVFTQDIPSEIDRAANVTVYLYANVVEIETDDAGENATTARVVCLGGEAFRVAAKAFVVATGGIENARLLLLSHRTHVNGLGNRYDVVGRFFMDHPQYLRDRLVPAKPGLFERTRLYDLRKVRGVPVMGRLGLPREVLERERLLNIGAMLFPRERGYWSENVSSVGTFLRAHVLPRRITKPLKYLDGVWAGLEDLSALAYRKAKDTPFEISHLAKGGWTCLPDAHARFKTFEMVSLVEQAPDPANRVKLARERDALGARKVELHWRFSETDQQASRRAREFIAAELAKAGIGRLDVHDEQPHFPSASHHMGATRMHPDPRQGVVNAECRVHGLSNLFIAGSSVFPTGSFANPTLTIVALATRLSDTIKASMRAPATSQGEGSTEVGIPRLSPAPASGNGSDPQPARALVVIPGPVNYFNNRLGHRVAEVLKGFGWTVSVSSLRAVVEDELDWCFLVSAAEIVHGHGDREDAMRRIAVLKNRSRRLALVILECAASRWAEPDYKLVRELGIDLYLDLNLLSQLEVVPADMRRRYHFVFNGLTRSERAAAEARLAAPGDRPIPWTFVGLLTPTRARLAHRLVRDVAPDGFLYLPSPREPYAEGSPHLSEDQFAAVLSRSRVQVWCSQFEHFFLEAERFRMSLLTGSVPFKVLLRPVETPFGSPFSRLLGDVDDLCGRLRELDFERTRQLFAEEFLELPGLEQSLGKAIVDISDGRPSGLAPAGRGRR